MSNIFSVSAAPHLHDNINTRSVMWQVAIALLPALIASIYYFGTYALMLTMLAIVAAALTEALIQKLRKVPVMVADGSAVVTGMLMAFNLNAGAPWWLPVAGSVFAVAIGKQVFGGLGHNPMNPALLGRAFLVASWPQYMVGKSLWMKTKFGSINGLNPEMLDGLSKKTTDFITSATPLEVIKNLRDSDFVNGLAATPAEAVTVAHDKILFNLTNFDNLRQLFWGNIGGCLGEVSAAALVLGAAWLLYKRIIEWRIPFSYIGTVFILTWIFGGIDGVFTANVSIPMFHIFSGGLMLGAFFMATDMVTSPVTRAGRLYFGIGCGLLTVVIRLVGGYPEGVSYSILLMNIVVPLIDRGTIPKAFGGRK